MLSSMSPEWSNLILVREITWDSIPEGPGVYVVFWDERLLYVGMAGASKTGGLRGRLRSHVRGNLVNMLQQYLWFGIVQDHAEVPTRTPQDASRQCRAFMEENLAIRFRPCADAETARSLEAALKRGDGHWGTPQLNPA